MRPFLPRCEILKVSGASVHVWDLSRYVANMSDGASLLISAHMRYCRWGWGWGWWGEGGGRLSNQHADEQKREEELTVTAVLSSQAAVMDHRDIPELRSSFS